LPELAGIESGRTRERREARAVALLLYTATVWGANVVVMKVMTGHFETVHLSAIRMALAFACIALICRCAGHRVPWPSRTQLVWLVAAAALMIYAHQLMLTQGLAWSTATNGALALSLNPLLSVLLGVLLFGEPLRPLGAAGVLLGLAGAAVVVLNRSGAGLQLSAAGDALLLASMLVYVAAGACIRRVSGELHALAIGFHMHWIGSAMLLVHAALTPAFWRADAWSPGWLPWLLIAVSALCSTALGSLAWNYGIARLGLGRTAVFINLLPVSGLAAAVLFLGETLQAVHGIGFALVLAGTWLAARPQRRQPTRAATCAARPGSP
jgi:drug/metabolite transporter (DMT)-like permease